MSVGTWTSDLEDTIVAVATGQQTAKRAIVRLSGPRVPDVVSKVFRHSDGTPFVAPAAGSAPQRWLGRVDCTISNEPSLGSVPAACWLWPSHRTYTGQPTAEFHLAGLPYLVDAVMRQCLHVGARPAVAGEFTMRAFLAGRMDLLQAQGVLQVIEADQPNQLSAALTQLAGGLSHPLATLREQLIYTLAQLEAGLDFVEEDIEFIDNHQLRSQLNAIYEQVESALTQLRQRASHHIVPRVALCGPPNAGKSSLFNALAGESLALVSGQKGTTRDYLSAQINLGPNVIELIDTAGLEQWLERPVPQTANSRDKRWHDPEVNRAGSRSESNQDATAAWDLGEDLDLRSQQAAWELLGHVDGILFCWEASDNVTAAMAWAKRLPQAPVLWVSTKNDEPIEPPLGVSGRDERPVAPLDQYPVASERNVSRDSIDHPLGLGPPPRWIQTSALTGQGLSTLLESLRQWLSRVEAERRSQPAMFTARTLDELLHIRESLINAIEAVDTLAGDEIVAAEIRTAIDRLGRLVGTIYTDDLLDSIFSQFCIGK